METKKPIIEKEHVVIKFTGDSGDGMQLTGHQFSDTSALMGNEVVTFPDYPAEIRAPKGTIGGVSGFQLNIGKDEVRTPGDFVDVLVAMNPAALKANRQWLKAGGTLIVDIDAFTEKNLNKVECVNPFDNDDLDGVQIIKAPMTKMVQEALVDSGLDNKSILRSRNMVALGIAYWLFQRDLSYTEDYLREKFSKKPEVAQANIDAVKAGYNFGENLQYIRSYKVNRAFITPGTYRNINGNLATAWGLLAAAEKANLPLFLGSYPITPASEILQEISNRKDLGAVSFQAEDEIAGIATSIGASFAGHFACTSTSGPGLALKSEAVNLAIIAELPLVIVDVQRGGPSTGLPTKPEQSDLLQALWGRNGASPIPVIAASTPSDCFEYAFNAGKIAVENMTPVLLLTDGFIANGSQPWKIASMKDLPEIKPRFVKEGKENYFPYERIEGTMVREWAVPGMKNYEHRIGGLEKMAVTGGVSYEPLNHEVMTFERAKKIADIAEQIPEQQVYGKNKGKLLIIGWGGTFGHIYTAYNELLEEGVEVSYTHFNYINPLPKNTEDIFKNFDKILICEMNEGQFLKYLRTEFPQYNYKQYNKIQGYPFTISELKTAIKQNLED
ncbi:MAG: 2-oxoacid:acceptor oxidoreductase subunit alpha [Bacteroidales bacterium]|nr:2-oxoacid:acceptor oxidoreductase subunit alpha [Bacteroidales bacterium]